MSFYKSFAQAKGILSSFGNPVNHSRQHLLRGLLCLTKYTEQVKTSIAAHDDVLKSIVSIGSHEGYGFMAEETGFSLAHHGFPLPTNNLNIYFYLPISLSLCLEVE